MKGFSIIICCHNSARKLPKTISYLNNLRRVENASFEVIIIDNNSTDSTREIAYQLIKQYADLDVVFDTELNTGKVYAFARAMKLSRFQYAIICDDDNWLDENYLQIAWDLLEANPRIGVIGGRGIIHTEATLPHWFSVLQNAWAVGKQAQYSGDITETKGAVWGAGMVLRKSVWNEALSKGFSAFLTGRKSESVTMTGEDSELCIIVKKLDYKIYYEEKLQYLHDIPESRLNWKGLKSLWEGFSRSQVYFDMYDYFFREKQDLTEADLRKIWRQSFHENFCSLFRGWRSLIWYKQIYITFVEDRQGYLNGLEKRKYLYRLKELWRIRKRYSSFYKIISSINV